MPVCLSALARPGLLHTKSVFVTGYALCHFLTSCVYSDSQDCSCLRRAGSRPAPARARPHRAPRVTFRGRGPAPAHMQCGGRFPDPRFTRYTDLTSQHAGHAARNFGAFQCHLTQSHVVQGLNALLPRVDVRLIEVTRGHRIGVEQRER